MRASTSYFWHAQAKQDVDGRLRGHDVERAGQALFTCVSAPPAPRTLCFAKRSALSSVILRCPPAWRASKDERPRMRGNTRAVALRDAPSALLRVTVMGRSSPCVTVMERSSPCVTDTGSRCDRPVVGATM